MIRLAVRLAPVLLLALPLWAYRAQGRRDVESARGWEQHTYAARMLAYRLKVEAGCIEDRPALARTLDEFAAATADNPSQVRIAAAMRAAAARGDLGGVSRLADAARAEEDRLLVIREAATDARLGRIWALADLALGMVLLVLAAQALAEYLERHRPRGPA